MAKHTISLSAAKIQIVNSDFSVVVKADDIVLGTLSISKGTIDWRPRKKQVGGKSEIHLSWRKFDELMRSTKK
ncbi:MAG: hypothetical protein ABI072_02715 [Edaphobacter sp.]